MNEHRATDHEAKLFVIVADLGKSIDRHLEVHNALLAAAKRVVDTQDEASRPRWRALNALRAAIRKAEETAP